MKKWIVVIILVIVGILAAIVAIEYLTVPIHKLPSFLGGKHHVKGHYQKRGDALAVVAVLALGGAGYLAYRIRRRGGSRDVSAAPAAPPPQATSGETLLANLPPATQAPPDAPADS